jgi:uncharacterized radical SAM superfamily protein
MESLGQARRSYVEQQAPEIGFARPGRTLAVSLTGTRCSLDCAHCGGHYLRGMASIEQADAAGMTSCLISGGCDRHGRVPVGSQLARVAELRPGRILNWHVGMIDEEQMRAIAPLVDVISFDFLVDVETIREVYGLDYNADDYLRTYDMLRRYTRVVPHLTLGLLGGRFRGEYRALELLRASGLEELVVLVFIPTAGTRYAHCLPPAGEEVIAFLTAARNTLPGVPIYLGCMRPGGEYRRHLDPLAVRAGVNKIVNPSGSAMAMAKQLGLRARWENECCVIQRR